MLGAGIPTTTQMNVTESVSFTVSMKFSGGNKNVGSTERKMQQGKPYHIYTHIYMYYVSPYVDATSTIV